MNIILMGYRCTGKSSAGRKLAALLGRPFHDTDELIRRRTGRTVEEIVAAEGWSVFREEERAVIGDLSGTDGSVIAPGGGALLDHRNVAKLKENGLFVWLIADAATIARRLEADPGGGANRPSLSGKPVADEVREILAEREPLYRQIADLVVDTASLTAEEVATAICSGLRGKIPPAGKEV